MEWGTKGAHPKEEQEDMNKLELNHFWHDQELYPIHIIFRKYLQYFQVRSHSDRENKPQVSQMSSHTHVFPAQNRFTGRMSSMERILKNNDEDAEV